MKKQTIIAALLLATTMSHGKTTPNRTETPANFEGYLFAYFEGRGDAKQQEHLRFALSDDGVNWRALNENRPVIASDTISESGGIRDPHILRGEDGRFYIVATDMNTAKNGWNENPGIVLLSSDDLLHWKHAKINLSKDYPKHFGDAYWVWAPQTIYDRKAKKYMIYFTLQRNDRKSLITYYAYANKDCFDSHHSWACIDPAVFIDDDGQAYLTWGNRECYIVKLKDNMIETEGEVKRIHIDESHPFTEAPWIHKHDGKYYLTYASEWPEKIAYAVADHIEGPYETKGIISEIAGNSNTTHPAIVNFKGQWIFISHNGGLPTGTSYSRSVVAEPMEYNADGSIKPIPPTAEGVKPL